jgi:hypothetical protein
VTAIALGCALSSAQAAGANRVWVSGHGVDHAGCGAPTAPCRSLQYAHDNAVAAGGEIDVLDPAGYGAVTITKALSIVNDGVGTVGVQATSGVAITINAGPSDSVFLRGLDVDGLNQSAGTGIYFHAGSTLTVVDCVVRHFSGNGIVVEPISGDVRALIANTIADDNGLAGIVSEPIGASGSIKGVIDHVTASDNFIGIALLGGASAATSSFAVSHTDSSFNSGDGLDTGTNGNSTSSVNIDSSYFNNNGAPGGSGVGLVADSAVVVRISRSVLDANASYGVANGASGATYSAGDNHMDGNPSGKVSGPALLADTAN